MGQDMMNFQKTLKNRLQVSGVGLHLGKKCTLTLMPAPADSGIRFLRTDVKPRVEIPALNSYVVNTTMSTSLGKDGVTVSTVEHLISAIWGLGLDNVLIELNGPEVPILDGSSLIFAKLIKKVGLKKQARPRRYLVITKPISITDGDRYGYLLPHKQEKFTCSIDFDHKVIGKQSFELQLNARNYYKEIARARTFGFIKDIEKLRKMGLIAGGSLENAIVLDDRQVINPEGLRFDNEFVRHKVLDTIGDVALMGMRILGHFITHKAGHELHYKLIRKVLIEECGYVLGAADSDEQDLLDSFRPLVPAISA